jgi:NAD(P)-dependent dehydrogenase (short-subunit alcohol dehydrogenase family)
MDFSNKQVVVTGGTGALGAEVVASLLRAGTRCMIPYRNDAEAQRFAHRGDPNVTLIAVGDLADEAEVAKLYGGLAASSPLWASIHIAGGFAPGNVADTGKAALMAQLNGNLVSCFLCCRAAVNAMRAGRQGGRIVNVASRQALEWRSGAGMAAYTIAKSGVATLTTTLAEEVVKENILVNAVAPSIMDTAANRAAMPKADFNVWPKAEEVAATILFLASPENKVTRGAIVPVYGKF